MFRDRSVFDFRHVLLFAALFSALTVSVAVAAPEAANTTPDPTLSWPLLAGSLAFLVPIGFALIAAGGLPAEEARQATLAGLAALALATLGYWACGFALQFGGVGLIHRTGGLEGLIPPRRVGHQTPHARQLPDGLDTTLGCP